MPRRGNSNMNSSMGGYNSGSLGRKNNINASRSLSGKSNFGGGMMNQVNPWLSQSNSNNPLGGLGRNLASDQQAQLALASTLLNNLLKPAAQLNKLPTTPPSLLSLNRQAPNSMSSFGGSSSGFNRDRFGFGRQNMDKIQKNYRKTDFKNKRFGDRKNKKPNQANKPANTDKKAEKKDVKKEEVKVDTMDLDQSARETSENTTVTETETNETTIESETKTKEEPSKTKPKGDEPKMSYSEIPAALLFCHICRKHMWDDSSFEKHLEGRPHKLMVEELDRSYKLKVDLLRHEMRVAEQQRENDIQRAHRKGKNNAKSQQRDFCTMCNLSFLGMLPAHRKNERHQRLKKFLHPKCNICSKEFYTRLEWDDHKLTPTHLKRLAEIRKETRPDLEDTEFDIIDFIEDIDYEYDMDNIELKVVGKRDSLNDLQKEKCEGATNDGETEKNETNEEKNEEDEEYKKLPKYSPGIPIGENFVIDRTGFLCRACNKFCLTSEDVKTHCQSVLHYNNIIKILKAQNKIVRKRRLNEAKTEDDAADKGDNKRCKTTVAEGEKPTELNGMVKTEPGSGGEAYDPEDPGSENEKDQETENSANLDTSTTVPTEPDPNDSLAESKNVISDTDDKKDDLEIQEVPEELSKEEKKPKPAMRGPRARRGRRH